jgi:hypothetical protein
MAQKHLTNNEKHAIKVLNFVAEYDGIIPDESDMEAILTYGIHRFVAESRQHLCYVNTSKYPIRIKTRKPQCPTS